MSALHLSPNTTATVRVLCEEQTHAVIIDLSSTVLDLKTMLRNGPLASVGDGMSVRLIFSGKVLDDNAQLGTAGVREDSVIHCALSVVKRVEPSTVPPVLGCGFEASQSAGPPSTATARRQLGFARLEAVGMTPDAVSALRANYYSEVRQLEAELPRRPDEAAEDHMARVEEAWMQRQQPTSEFAVNVAPLLRSAADQSDMEAGGSANSSGGGFFDHLERLGDSEDEGTVADFFWGAGMGFFLGFLMLIWVWQDAVSHRQKLGVFFGIFCNMFVTVLRQSSATQEAM